MPETRAEKIVTSIETLISSRVLQEGERLPSIRGYAGKMKVSPSTVAEAYDRLVAEGRIYARRGSGFYVSNHIEPVPLTHLGPELDREIDPFWVSRQSLDADERSLKPGCGWLPANQMPVEVMKRALRKTGRSEEALFADYGSTQGSTNLRRSLSRRYIEEGLSVSPEQILLTSSGTQAVDLVCRFLLQAGDTVLVDDPCYFNFQALLRAHKVSLISVPMGPEGPDVTLFEKALKTYKPKLYITNSAIHNPTGASLSPKVAHRLLNLAETHNLVIIEDDIFADFEEDPSLRLAVLDGLDRVIRIGSFSKTLSASVRCGHIAAKAGWIDALIDLQVATSFGGPSPLATELIYNAISDSGYRRHLGSLRQSLARQRREVADRLADLAIKPWLMPRGGFYLWCRLPEGICSADLARLALEENVILAPGNVFSVSRNVSHFMRFNTSQMKAPKLYEMLERNLKKFS